MTSSEEELVHSTLLEIEAMIRDLHWTGATGYYMGYELGYMKGVLEHLLLKHPNVKTRGEYLEGYLNGYGQGLLYLSRSNALVRPEEPHSYGNMPDVVKVRAEITATRDGYGQGLLYLSRSNALVRPEEPHSYGDMPDVVKVRAESASTRNGYGLKRLSIEDVPTDDELFEIRRIKSILKSKN